MRGRPSVPVADYVVSTCITNAALVAAWQEVLNDSDSLKTRNLLFRQAQLVTKNLPIVLP